MKHPRTIATGARKRDWERLLELGALREPAVFARAIPVRDYTCSKCGEAMVMSEAAAIEAEQHPEWPKVCLVCVCDEAGIAIPEFLRGP